MPPHDQRATEPSDKELIARWQRGDERAASLLVERHADAVGRYVSSLGVREQVQDVVQDTFVRAFRSIEGFRGDSSLRTWLFTISRRLVADTRRAERRRQDRADLVEGDASTEYDALDQLIAEESRQRMHEAIGRLSPTQREV